MVVVVGEVDTVEEAVDEAAIFADVAEDVCAELLDDVAELVDTLEEEDIDDDEVEEADEDEADDVLLGVAAVVVLVAAVSEGVVVACV